MPELCLEHHVGRNACEWTVHILLAEHIFDQGWSSVHVERFPNLCIDRCARGQSSCRAEPGYGLESVSSHPAIDLSDRELGAIQEYLRPEHSRSFRLVVQLIRSGRVIYRCKIIVDDPGSHLRRRMS